MNIKFRYLLIAAFMVGCSDGGGGNGNGPRAGIKSKIPNNGSAALTGQTAVFEASQGFGSAPGLSGPLMNLVAGALPSESMRATKGKVGRIQDAIMNGRCKIETSQPNNDIGSSSGAAAQFPRMHVKIAGPQCPMEVILDMNIAGNSNDICKDAANVKVCKFVAGMKMTYRILDSNLSEELQVSRGQMNMLFNMEQALPGSSSSRSSEVFNMVIKGRVEIGFEAYDAQEQAHVITGSQDIDMKMTMSNSGNPNGAADMTMAMKEEIQYKHEASKTASSFSASVNVNGNNSVEHYVIDGVAVTAETYNSEREKFANSMMAFGKNDQKGKDSIDSRNSNSGKWTGPGMNLIN